ncbi:MAG: flagellar basal-body rod protein FlgF [Alphaproteobacteria bacterium]|nr:flagellar basal-body rod protein FlgF [Alphaproteobacteria bacterium]
MENIAYVGMSQQVALQQQMQVAANNIANMSTPGYKAEGVLFQQYITAPKNADPIKQVQNFGTFRDLEMGNLTQTHNPLDMAIEGDGYFAVTTPQGVRYTRDGGFALNTARQIVTKSGHPLLNENGDAITVPPDATQITISADGTIVSEYGDIGRVKLVNFADPQKLKKLGDNLYDAGGQPEQPLARRDVVQGVLEGSNVNPVVEMNKMIGLLRMFQAAQNMLQNDHDRITKAIDTLTTVT